MVWGRAVHAALSPLENKNQRLFWQPTMLLHCFHIKCLGNRTASVASNQHFLNVEHTFRWIGLTIFHAPFVGRHRNAAIWFMSTWQKNGWMNNKANFEFRFIFSLFSYHVACDSSDGIVECRRINVSRQCEIIVCICSRFGACHFQYIQHQLN